MSPHEFDGLRDAFRAAASSLGWTEHVVTVEHEREWACSSEDKVWRGPEGEYLFSLDTLSRGMAREVIRLAGIMLAMPS